MADVPLFPIGAVTAPSPLPGPRFQGGDAAQFGAEGAREKQAFAGAAQDLVNEQVMLQSQVRVNDALNQVRQKALDLTYGDQGYAGLLGRNALDRPDGQALPDEYGSKLRSTVADVGGTLTPQQQRVFNMQAADLQTSFVGDVQRHMLTQSHAYALSVQDSTLKLASDTAAQHWDDPRAINGGVDDQGNPIPGIVQQAKAAVYASGKLTGQDVQAAMLQAGSAIHTRVIEAALENSNPLYATSYLQAHSKDMTSDDILRVQARVNQNADANVAHLATDAAAKQVQPAIAPAPMDRLTGLVAQAESGSHETNADGSTVTSTKGAKGVMQVMDATAANPGFGIKPAARLPDGSFDPADRARVGREYLGALVQRYGGNVGQALAAYNAGPEPVDKAVAEAKEVGEPGLWFQSEHIPDETRAYVQSITAKFDAGGGAAPLPTKEQFVQAALSQLGPNPRLSQTTLTRTAAEQRYTLMLQSRDERGDQVVRAAQQQLIANGGDFVSWQRNNPDQVAAVGQWAPGKMDDLATFAKHISRGENTTNLVAYGQAVQHPQELAKLSDAQMDQFVKTNMSAADGEKLYRLRAEYLPGGSADQSAGSLNQEALNAKLHPALRDLGIDWQAKDSDTRTRYGDVQQVISDGILAQQRQQGRKFTAADIDAYVDQQMARSTVVSRWFGLSHPSQRLFASTIGDISGADQDAIRAQLAKEGNPAPTDSDVLKRFLAVKSNGR